MSEKEIKEVVTVIILTVWAVLLIATALTILEILQMGELPNAAGVSGFVLGAVMFIVSINTFLKGKS